MLERGSSATGRLLGRLQGKRIDMWLLFFVVPIAIVLLVGGLLAGGIYTIVFLPIALIIAGGAVLYTMWGRSTEPQNVPGERERVQPLPHTQHANTAHAPSTPDQLVDARRAEQ
jgi:hypothetical protein